MSNQSLGYENIEEYDFTNNQNLNGIELNAQYPHHTKKTKTALIIDLYAKYVKKKSWRSYPESPTGPFVS